jgi:hypothetical protein
MARVSISNRCVHSPKYSFGKFLDPDLTAMLGSQGRADTVNGTSRHSLYLLYLVRLKQTTPLDWLVRVHDEVSSSVSSCPYGHSFVPAESATLGIVDKSAFQHAICGDSGCATLFFLISICPSFHPRSNPRVSLQSNLAIKLFAFTWTTADT